MILIETTPGIGGVGITNSRGGEFMYDNLIHCKNLCKCHDVPPPSRTMKKKIFLKNYKTIP
jgi:hypothetical protein